MSNDELGTNGHSSFELRHFEDGTPPWCCPTRAEFWRLCCANWRAAHAEKVESRWLRVERNAAVRASALNIQHSTLNKSKGPSCSALRIPRSAFRTAHAISTKNKHLLLSCDTNPRFHGGCFGVWGTPPPKPLNCKAWLNRLGALRRGIRRHHAGDEPWLACADFRFVLTDILTMPF
jgi:hypothetical protein